MTEAGMRAWIEDFRAHESVTQADTLYQDPSHVCLNNAGPDAIQKIIDDAPDAPYANAELERALGSVRDATEGGRRAQAGDVSKAAEAFEKLDQARAQAQAFADKVQAKFPGINVAKDFDFNIGRGTEGPGTAQETPAAEPAKKLGFGSSADTIGATDALEGQGTGGELEITPVAVAYMQDLPYEDPQTDMFAIIAFIESAQGDAGATETTEWTWEAGRPDPPRRQQGRCHRHPPRRRRARGCSRRGGAGAAGRARVVVRSLRCEGIPARRRLDPHGRRRQRVPVGCP
ncbi:hypothetical protein [Streptomyces sp. 7N604]|uniref:hypothetical protein n=1 Tax=Streptomyces sp. 7N604 TaxID=3457415 RepID=UPI003FCEF6F9